MLSFIPSLFPQRDGSTELRMPLVEGVVITGCSTISGGASAAYGAYMALSVPTKRLDEIYEGDVGLIKIDVEGHEQAVLDGAIETVRRCRPRMLVEVDERLAPGGLEGAKKYFTGPRLPRLLRLSGQATSSRSDCLIRGRCSRTR